MFNPQGLTNLDNTIDQVMKVIALGVAVVFTFIFAVVGVLVHESRKHDANNRSTTR